MPLEWFKSWRWNSELGFLGVSEWTSEQECVCVCVCVCVTETETERRGGGGGGGGGKRIPLPNLLVCHAAFLNIARCIHKHRWRKGQVEQPVGHTTSSQFVELCVQFLKSWSFIICTLNIVTSLEEILQQSLLIVFYLKHTHAEVWLCMSPSKIISFGTIISVDWFVKRYIWHCYSLLLFFSSLPSFFFLLSSLLFPCFWYLSIYFHFFLSLSFHLATSLSPIWIFLLLLLFLFFLFLHSGKIWGLQVNRFFVVIKWGMVTPNVCCLTLQAEI